MLCGIALLGETDYTDTVFVGTTFFHIFFFPLCPLESYLVVRKTYRSGCRASYTAESLGGLEARSVCYGYLQGIARFCTFLCLLLGIIEIYRVQSAKNSHYMEYTLMWVGVILAPWVLLGLVNWLKGNQASQERVNEIRGILTQRRQDAGRENRPGISNGTLAPLQTQINIKTKPTAQQIQKNEDLGEPLLPI